VFEDKKKYLSFKSRREFSWEGWMLSRWFYLLY